MRDHATDHQPATVIHDRDGVARYLLAGKWGLRQDVLSLYNMSGDLLAEVCQLSLGLLPKYALMVDHQRVGVVGKSLGFVREVVYIRGLNWMIVGNALTNHYRVFRGSHQVFAMAPSEDQPGLLAISIQAESDEPLALLVAAVLNHWAQRPDKEPLLAKLKLPPLHAPQPGLSAGWTQRPVKKATP